MIIKTYIYIYIYYTAHVPTFNQLNLFCQVTKWSLQTIANLVYTSNSPITMIYDPHSHLMRKVSK